MSYTIYRNQICRDALENVGAIKPGEDPTPTMMMSAALKINMIVQALPDYLPWKVEEKTKTFTAPTVKLVSGLNYRCIKNHTATATDQPGVGVNWTTYWTQDGTAGTAWVVGDVCTTPGEFDLTKDTIAIEQAFIRFNNADRWLDIITRSDYSNEPLKHIAGEPLSLWFQALNPTPKVYLLPQPDVANIANYVLHYFEVQRPSDMPYGSSTPDIQPAQLNALSDILTAALAPKYVPATDTIRLNVFNAREREAKKLFKTAMFETDTCSRVTPAF